jgi:hypothetical protein
VAEVLKFSRTLDLGVLDITCGKNEQTRSKSKEALEIYRPVYGAGVCRQYSCVTFDGADVPERVIIRGGNIRYCNEF